jgi:hypothetical protein
VRTVDRLLTPWWKQGLRGLPIGPEISGVIGDALLVPMDDALEEFGVRSNRFMDDIQLFGRSELSEGGLAVIDSVIGRFGVVRAEDKTIRFDDPREALRRLRSQETVHPRFAAQVAGSQAARCCEGALARGLRGGPLESGRYTATKLWFTIQTRHPHCVLGRSTQAPAVPRWIPKNLLTSRWTRARRLWFEGLPLPRSWSVNCLVWGAAANCDEPEVQDTAQWMLRRAA